MFRLVLSTRERGGEGLEKYLITFLSLVAKKSFQTCILKMGKKPPPPKPEELIEKLDEKVILKNIIKYIQTRSN